MLRKKIDEQKFLNTDLKQECFQCLSRQRHISDTVNSDTVNLVNNDTIVTVNSDTVKTVNSDNVNSDTVNRPQTPNAPVIDRYTNVNKDNKVSEPMDFEEPNVFEIITHKIHGFKRTSPQ